MLTIQQASKFFSAGTGLLVKDSSATDFNAKDFSTKDFFAKDWTAKC
jgi:hypothetical protein